MGHFESQVYLRRAPHEAQARVFAHGRRRSARVPIWWVGRGGVTHLAHRPFILDNIISPTAPSKPVYASTARSHVRAAMDGYNAVVFAYGQTASGKTFTLVGGLLPRLELGQPNSDIFL